VENEKEQHAQRVEDDHETRIDAKYPFWPGSAALGCSSYDQVG
jgi:hypothetical protein